MLLGLIARESVKIFFAFREVYIVWLGSAVVRASRTSDREVASSIPVLSAAR